MKAACPNDPTHKEFVTVAHITQDWLVDDEGNFLDLFEDCLEITHGPDEGNSWTCNICGAEAKVY